jgi:hypothetical protein
VCLHKQIGTEVNAQAATDAAMKYADTRCKGGAQLGEGGARLCLPFDPRHGESVVQRMTQSHLVAAVAIATAIIVVIGVILGTGPWRSRETYLPASSSSRPIQSPSQNR